MSTPCRICVDASILMDWWPRCLSSVPLYYDVGQRFFWGMWVLPQLDSVGEFAAVVNFK